MKLKFSLSDRINTVFKHCHPSLISENVGNLLINLEKVLDLWPVSQRASFHDDLTMYLTKFKNIHTRVSQKDRRTS